MGRYKQTAHHPNNPSGSVIITNPIHPLFGQTVSVRRIRRLGRTLQISLNHPDGGTLSLSAKETNFETHEQPDSSNSQALLAVHQLMILIDRVAVQVSKPLPRVANTANADTWREDKGVDQSKSHASSSLPAHRSLRRDKYPTPKTD